MLEKINVWPGRWAEVASTGNSFLGGLNAFRFYIPVMDQCVLECSNGYLEV